MRRAHLLFITVLLIAGTRSSGQADEEVRLIVRGDDMGFSHAANLACIQSYTDGVMRSVEVMVPGPWFPEAVDLLNQHPGLDVGIHLTLNCEWEPLKWRPLTHCPSLVDHDGYFFRRVWSRDDSDKESLASSDWKLDEIEKELRAQIELALEKIPRCSHVTGHMAFQKLDPKIDAVVERLAKEYKLGTHASLQGLKRVRLFDNVQSREEKVSRAMAVLNELTPGTWYFVEHPALDTPEIRAISTELANQRADVTSVFTSPRLKAAVDRRDIKLVSYGDLSTSLRRKPPR